MIYSKRHNKFLFPSLAGAIYGSTCKAKNEISNVVNYKTGCAATRAEQKLHLPWKLKREGVRSVLLF